MSTTCTRRSPDGLSCMALEQASVKMMCRLLLGLLSLATAAGCATMDAGEPRVLIDTAVRGEPFAGVACAAAIDELHWDVVTPAAITVGDARGELRVVCNHPGYRTSEVIFRPVTGMPLPATGLRYPKRLTLDMNPP